ncbi:MAG: ATP-binding protein [Sandaracinus sp.]
MSEVATLVRFRWAALLAQLVALVASTLVLGIALPLAPLGALLAIFALSNGALAYRPSRRAVGPVILGDVVLLTLALALAGGPSNPFSIVYLVYVTLASVAVPGGYAWATVVLSALGYGALFFVAPGDPHAHHHHPGMSAGGAGDTFSLHLQGMWAAFTIAAVLIAVFVTRVSRALATERENVARTARLLGLTTLAAGAAHELATPLSTIKTIAGELERALEDRPDLEDLRDDARLVRQEVDRSRAVLERLSLRAGELRGEAAAPMRLGDLASSLAELPEALRTRVDLSCTAPDREATVPRRALAQVVTSLVKNGLDASGETGRVDLRLRVADRSLVIEVEDHGSGMSEDALARAGEPFFTTKEPGRGMGLGLFLARTLVSQLGGTLDLVSSVGRGTCVTVKLPTSAGEGAVA